MGYYIIIRGPLGIGKSTIAKKLSKILKAKYMNIDFVLKKYKLDKVSSKAECIPAGNFIKADDIILPKIKGELKKSKRIVFDACFYHKKHIEHLIKKLPYKHYVFTLKAPLRICIERDNKRRKTLGGEAAKAVHKLVSRFDYGIIINVNNKGINKIIKEIISYLPKKILCICAVGVNRSKYLASYLRRKGYSTKFGGIDYKEYSEFKPIKQKDVDWADIIIITRKRLKSIFKKKFNSKNKKIIVIDVPDNKRSIPEEMAHLRKLGFKEFQRKWTRPQLRKAIKKYMPF